MASPLVTIRPENFGSLQSKTSVSALASSIGLIMPESYEGENFSRAETLARGPSIDAIQEHIKIAIFKLSNKLRTSLSWDQTLEVLEMSGIMSARVQLNQHSDSSRTISALAEALYRDAFRFLYRSRFYEAPENLQSRSVKLVTWLLSLGYCSDTYIYLHYWRNRDDDYSLDSKATGLQIAILCKNYELACVLLDAGADPSLLSHHMHPWNGDHLLLLPPLAIAICCEPSPGKTAIIRRLLAAGVDISAEQECKRGFIVKLSVLRMLVGCAEEEEAEMQEVMDVLCMGQAKFVTADVLISAAWDGKMKNLELLLRINPDVNMTNPLGLTALHAAAYQGHTEICKMLLLKGSFADYPDQDAPSPLHLASYQNHVAIVALLHSHGASLLRGIKITTNNYAVVFSRYFLDTFQDDTEERSYSMKGWEGVKELASLLESPVGAAVYASDDQRGNTVTYLVQHGVELPASTVYFASSRRFPQLLSLALRQNLNPDDLGPDCCTPLQRALLDVHVNETPACVQMASHLLDNGATIVGGEAILALSNLGSWDIVERVLSSDYDDVAERYDLIPRWRDLRVRIGSTLLETAILRGSGNLIQLVLARKPNEYSAGALCAASLHAAREGNGLYLLERLLENRKNQPAKHREDPVCETTAVSIAAWTGDSAMLKVLHKRIPVSHLAYLPNGDTAVKLASTVADPPHDSRSGSLSFWHEACFDTRTHLMGSPVNFAFERRKILDQLLGYGYKLDRISLVIMANSGDASTMRSLIQDQDILHNEYASRIHSPLYHAITNGDLESSTLLLELGEDIDDNENEVVNSIDVGRNPLARAVEMNDLSLIKMLLDSGADLNVPPSWYSGMTALQCAAAQGSLGIAKKLIDLGADMNAGRGKTYGRTALEAAAECGRIDMVQFLLSEGVETTGNGRHQYVAAIARAKLQGNYVTANILKKHRPWTDEDRILWQDEDLLGSEEEGGWEAGDLEGWEEDDDEYGMASAGEEETNSTRSHLAREMIEITEEDDGTDWDSSNSIARNAPLVNGSDLMKQDVFAEPGFAFEVNGMGGEAVDWDAFLANGPTSINEDVIAGPGFIVEDALAGNL
jgi:ankyrin repeat protein